MVLSIGKPRIDKNEFMVIKVKNKLEGKENRLEEISVVGGVAGSVPFGSYMV